MEKLIDNGPMERELIADVALMEPGKDRGKKLLFYVWFMTPEEREKVLAHFQQEVGFSDEQMKTLRNDYDVAKKEHDEAGIQLRKLTAQMCQELWPTH
jgi:hypothetical protein